MFAMLPAQRVVNHCQTCSSIAVAGEEILKDGCALCASTMRPMPLQDGVSISASDETSIDVGVLSFQNYKAATQQALTQYNVHSVRPSCNDYMRQLKTCAAAAWHALQQDLAGKTLQSRRGS